MNKIQCCSVDELLNKWGGTLPEAIFFFDEKNHNKLSLAFWNINTQSLDVIEVNFVDKGNQVIILPTI